MVKVIRRQSWRRSYLVLIPLVLLAVYSYWALTKPLPSLPPEKSTGLMQTQSGPSKLQWPGVGQSAVGVVGTPILDTHGPQTSAPTASTAKIITALTILHTKPLKPGDQGPTVHLTANDAALYSSYLARDGSVVPVQAGEQISEYQMLEAMLLPSANNMADSLAIWAFGSLPAYSKAAQAYVQQLGLTATHIGVDASGLDPSTTSNAHDLVRLGELVMQNPILAQIVGQPSAAGIPLVNSVKNVNFLLGTANIIGVKTGNSDQAGGVYVAAARTSVDGKPTTIVTALLSAPTLFEALKDSLPLIQSAQTNFSATSIAAVGTVVGRYHQPWGGNIPAITSQALIPFTWNDQPITADVRLHAVPGNTSKGLVVGSVTTTQSASLTQQTVPVKLQHAPTTPTIWWRLLHT